VDRSAVFVDARNPDDFQTGSMPRAVNLPASQLERGKDVGEVRRAKDDGRLPMEDHNARVIVFGQDGTQAQAVAEAITGEACHNVSFYGGTFATASRGHRANYETAPVVNAARLEMLGAIPPSV
jgi:rhodanese-related sulfurtransferase